jgi:hypothetical protein
MIRGSTVLAAAAALLLGAQALAADFPPKRVSGKHVMQARVADCMRKRMTASRTVTYYEATKECKVRIANQSGDSTAGTRVASATHAGS